MQRLLAISFAAGLVGAVLAGEAGRPAPKQGTPARVQYARDVQPILAAHCFTCHGPDEKTRKAGLRLDVAEVATRTLKSGSRAVVPGDSKTSELIARVFSTDSDRMPPASSHKPL